MSSTKAELVDGELSRRAGSLDDGPFPNVIEYSGYQTAAPHDLLAALAQGVARGQGGPVPDAPPVPGTSTAVGALIAADFAPLQGFVLTMAVMYVALNLVIDILYGVIDPRVRIEA